MFEALVKYPNGNHESAGTFATRKEATAAAEAYAAQGGGVAYVEPVSEWSMSNRQIGAMFRE